MSSRLPPATRREVSAGIAALGAASVLPTNAGASIRSVRETDRRRAVALADGWLKVTPRTITSTIAPRSPGSRNDYYSEADYWWPDPLNPQGPYVRRDGLSNPDKFDGHRDAMIELSLAVPSLAAAWKVTRDLRYAAQAERFLEAWFVDPATRMNPRLDHAQAIIGINSGRGIGVIDTVHLVEVARAVAVLDTAHPRRFTLAKGIAIRAWFGDYLTWLTTSKNGTDEREERNNHGTCWALQAAEFARLTGNAAVLGDCVDRFRTRLVVDQIAPDGSFPLELARTKPYGYCLFNLDALAALAHIASSPGNDLWQFETPDGRSLRHALAFMARYIRDKRNWPYRHDVEYFDAWPMRHISLLFGGLALRDIGYLELWRTLPPDSKIREVIRNTPLRQPLLWIP